MKNIVLSVGKKIRSIARAGKHRYGKLLGRSTEGSKSSDSSKPMLPAMETAELKAEGALSDANSLADPKREKNQETEKNRPKPKRKPAWRLEEFPVTPVEGKSRFHD